jgi:hypothetical protein
LSIGYLQNGTLSHGLPPRPPLNLDPVFLCQDNDEVCRFTDKPGYLRLILRNVGGPVPVDQLLVAHIKDCYQLRGRDTAWAMRTVDELIDLLRSNYDLLMPTLEAISETIPGLERMELL